MYDAAYVPLLWLCGIRAEFHDGRSSLVCYEKTDRICLLEMLRKERCTVLCSVPTVYIRLIREMREGKAGGEDLCLRCALPPGRPVRNIP